MMSQLMVREGERYDDKNNSEIRYSNRMVERNGVSERWKRPRLL